MRCGSSGVESFTTLRERAGDVTTGAKFGLAITLGNGATIRVGAVVAGTGATVGVMAEEKRYETYVRARSVSLPTVEKGAAGSGLDSALARFLVDRVATSVKEGTGMTHWCRKNCTVLAMRLVQVFQT